jgi:hypothetical protein
MAAWVHNHQWNDALYSLYRAYVADEKKGAPSLRKRKEDCADLSIMLLINFAADYGLPVTFNDVDGYVYISKGSYAYGRNGWIPFPWLTKQAFTQIVQKNIQTKALWEQNTVKNSSGPKPGDLLMRLTYYPTHIKVDKHHTAPIFAVYPAGTPHPRARDLNLPSFPGDDKAMEEFGVTEYFRGTVNVDGRTAYRHEDRHIHFDYLNSRGDDKRNAELIYYANASQFADDGFEFRKYAPKVLDNWSDWNGEGMPPRGIGFRSMFSKNNEKNDDRSILQSLPPR